MPRYIVRVREVHIQNVHIDADDEADALEKVAGGEGDHNPLADGSAMAEYSHTLDTDEWTVIPE